MVKNSFQERKIDISYRVKKNVRSPVAYTICYSAKSTLKQFYKFIYHDVSRSMYYERKHAIFTKNWDKLIYK